jgi:large subunit ribosomal protein L10
MSKQVKDLITKELTGKLEDLEGLAVINPRGISAIKNNLMRRRLHEKGLKMTVVRNTLARRAVSGESKLKGFDGLLAGPSAVIYGPVSIPTIARVVLDEKKADDTIELRGVFFDGEMYLGDKGVEQVSKLPTREEAIGSLVSLILSPARNLAGIFKGQGGKIASILKTVEDRAKDKEGGTPAADAAPAA